MIRWNHIASFYGVALAGSGLAALVMFAVGDALGPVGRAGFAGAAMLAPLFGTLVVQRVDGERVFEGLGARPRLSRWLAMASGMALLVVAIATAVGGILPGAAFDWEMNGLIDTLGQTPGVDSDEVRAQLDALPVHPVFLAIPQAVIAGFTINALFAFGEEIGWRGWLHRELAPLGFWKSNLVGGLLWGFWHAPLIAMGHNYPTQRLAGVFLFTLICVGLAPLHSAVREKAGTVWAAAVLHGTFNAAAGVATLVVTGGELMVGVQGVAGLVAVAVANLGLLLWRRAGAP